MADARVILSDLSWGKPIDFIDHKGGIDASQAAIARVLKITAREDKLWIQVVNSPGQALPEGAVKPAGQPYAEISIPLTIFEGRKLGFACLAYLQAWEVAKMIIVSPAPPALDQYVHRVANTSRFGPRDLRGLARAGGQRPHEGDQRAGPGGNETI